MSQEMPHMDYTREIECDYKKHHYSVRDNGSIMRHQEGFFPLEGAEWTFGSPNANGKLAYKGVLIERIVATAFLGEAEGVWMNMSNDTNTKIRIIRSVYRNYDFADDDLVFTLLPMKEE